MVHVSNDNENKENDEFSSNKTNVEIKFQILMRQH